MQPSDAQAASTASLKSDESYQQRDWSYEGYRPDQGDFTTAIVHLYRAEITRANTWRNRLDVTTNWAMVATGTAISFAFTAIQVHHSLILLNMLLVTVMLFIEARRYRYYELWSYRVRLLETGFFAALLTHPFQPGLEWSQHLSQSLKDPEFSITLWEALGRRLRRNYAWIFLVLQLAWLAKLLLYPQQIDSLDDLFSRGRMGIIPGQVVTAGLLAFDGVMLGLALLTRRLREADGEIQ